MVEDVVGDLGPFPRRMAEKLVVEFTFSNVQRCFLNNRVMSYCSGTPLISYNEDTLDAFCFSKRHLNED